MLFDPRRHEPLRASAWDEGRARATIAQIVCDTETRFDEHTWWPMHPLDADGGPSAPVFPLYFGACGVIWALHHLAAVGATTLLRDYGDRVLRVLPLNRAWLEASGSRDVASYLMGDTSILMLQRWRDPRAEVLDELHRLIVGNMDNPAREMLWGSPGTMLAALLLHRHTGEARFADAFVATARLLKSQLVHSREFDCDYWTQDLYGRRTNYIDAVHGFVGTALPLIHGRDLLTPREWDDWAARIAATVAHTALRDENLANWRPWLYPDRADQLPLMQYCHGAPGFVVCLGELPGTALDELLIAAGEAVWTAGPLRKGSNLCHGTAGNGYAFLKLALRTGDARWLARARAFAMHAVDQFEDHAKRYGQLRYSLWTGDLGLAIYLWNCIEGGAEFPTLDVFFTP
jgi:hypothetical protein